MRKMLILLLFFCLAGKSSAQSLTVLPAAPVSNIGDSLNVEIHISDLGAFHTPSISVFDIDLVFDDSVINFVGVSYGDGLDILKMGSFRTATLGAGKVNIFEMSLDSADDLDLLQPADFRLATLTFLAASPGVSSLSLHIGAIGDALGQPLSATVVDSEVRVSAVPEPNSFILLLFGLAAIGLLRFHQMPFKYIARDIRKPGLLAEHSRRVVGHSPFLKSLSFGYDLS